MCIVLTNVPGAGGLGPKGGGVSGYIQPFEKDAKDGAAAGWPGPRFRAIAHSCDETGAAVQNSVASFVTQ
jgi:hypothetical protein